MSITVLGTQLQSLIEPGCVPSPCLLGAQGLISVSAVGLASDIMVALSQARMSNWSPNTSAVASLAVAFLAEEPAMPRTLLPALCVLFGCRQSAQHIIDALILSSRTLPYPPDLSLLIWCLTQGSILFDRIVVAITALPSEKHEHLVTAAWLLFCDIDAALMAPSLMPASPVASQLSLLVLRHFGATESTADLLMARNMLSVACIAAVQTLGCSSVPEDLTTLVSNNVELAGIELTDDDLEMVCGITEEMVAMDSPIASFIDGILAELNGGVTGFIATSLSLADAVGTNATLTLSSQRGATTSTRPPRPLSALAASESVVSQSSVTSSCISLGGADPEHDHDTSDGRQQEQGISGDLPELSVELHTGFEADLYERGPLQTKPPAIKYELTRSTSVVSLTGTVHPVHFIYTLYGIISSLSAFYSAVELSSPLLAGLASPSAPAPAPAPVPPPAPVPAPALTRSSLAWLHRLALLSPGSPDSDDEVLDRVLGHLLVSVGGLELHDVVALATDVISRIEVLPYLGVVTQTQTLVKAALAAHVARQGDMPLAIRAKEMFISSFVLLAAVSVAAAHGHEIDAAVVDSIVNAYHVDIVPGAVAFRKVFASNDDILTSLISVFPRDFSETARSVSFALAPPPAVTSIVDKFLFVLLDRELFRTDSPLWTMLYGAELVRSVGHNEGPAIAARRAAGRRQPSQPTDLIDVDAALDFADWVPTTHPPDEVSVESLSAAFDAVVGAMRERLLCANNSCSTPPPPPVEQGMRPLYTTNSMAARRAASRTLTAAFEVAAERAFSVYTSIFPPEISESALSLTRHITSAILHRFVWVIRGRRLSFIVVSACHLAGKVLALSGMLPPDLIAKARETAGLPPLPGLAEARGELSSHFSMQTGAGVLRSLGVPQSEIMDVPITFGPEPLRGGICRFYNAVFVPGMRSWIRQQLIPKLLQQSTLLVESLAAHIAQCPGDAMPMQFFREGSLPACPRPSVSSPDLAIGAESYTPLTMEAATLGGGLAPRNISPDGVRLVDTLSPYSKHVFSFTRTSESELHSFNSRHL